MPEIPSLPRTFSRARRWLLASNLAIIIALTLYLVIGLNLIVFRHPVRFDFTVEKVHTLSGETRTRLGLVQEEVRVIIPTFFQAENPLHQIERQVFTRARGLLIEYIALQPRIRISEELDLLSLENASRWKKLCQDLKLVENQINRFYFVSGKEDAFRQVVTLEDLAVYDKPVTRLDPTPPRIHKFQGERAFTAALTRLLRRERPKIYFTTDWGEPSIDQEGEGELADLRRELELNGYEARKLSLAKMESVPPDCDLLAVIAPSRPLSAADQGKLEDYLRREGRLWAALGINETELERVLANWGIDVPKGQIFQESTAFGKYSYWFNTVIATEFNAGHPITRDFQRGSFQVGGGASRPIGSRGGDDLDFTWLYRTPLKPASLLDVNRNRIKDPSEKTGQFNLAAAVSRKPPERPPPGWKPLATRLAVFGDSSCLRNGELRKYSHRDVALNTVRWLLGREEEVGIGDSEWKEHRVPWTPEVQQFLFWVPIFLFPGIVLCMGVFVYVLRRS